MWTRSFSTSLRALTRAAAGLPSLSSRMTSTLRPPVEPQTDAVAEVQPEGGHLAVEADLLRLREGARDLVGGHAGLDERDRLVHPLARLLVGGDLRLRRAAHAEGAVVARAVADE